MTPEQLILAEQVREDRDRGAIKPIEPNRYGLGLSKVLRGARDAMNWPGKIPKSVPLVGDMGLGDFVFGQGPEYAEDLAYGFGKGRGGGLQWRLDPRAVDLAGTPTFGAVGGAKLLANQVRKGVQSAGTAIPGRREALKKIGTLGAAGAAATGAGGLAKLIRKGASAADITPTAITPTAITPTAIGKVAADVGTASVDDIVSQLTPRVLSGHRRYIDEEFMDVLERNLPEADVDRIYDYMGYDEFPPDLRAKADEIMNKEYLNNENILEQLREETEAALKEFGEVSPTYMEHSMGGIFTDPHPEGFKLPHSPHVRLDQGGMTSETIGIVDDWLKATGRTGRDMRQYIMTGKFPPDFPDVPVSYFDFIQQWVYPNDPGVVRIPEKPWKDE